LHLPQANWAIFQNGACYSGIKIFNGLPTEIKDPSDSPNKFKIALNFFLIHTVFMLWINSLSRKYVIDKQYSMFFFFRVTSISMKRK